MTGPTETRARRDRSPGRSVLAGVGLLGIAIVSALFLAGPDPRVMPVEPSAWFDPAFRRLSAEYAGTKYALWAAGAVLRWGALAGLIALGAGPVLAGLGRRLGRGRGFPSAFFAAFLLLAALALVVFPLNLASGFHVEQRYGLSTQSFPGWALDTARRQAFWIVVYAAAAAGFLACLRRWPRRGWLVAALGGVLVAVAGAMLAPVVIDPLFDDFTPLADRGLEAEIVAMGTRAGVEVDRVRVVDASRRTRRLNAYVTGLGATRQVVLYDNLLERAPREELLLVVAHELGHAAGHHVRKGLLWAVPGIVFGAWLLAGIARWRAGRDARQAGPGDPALLPLLWLSMTLLLFVSSPIESGVSRRMEAGADWLALELTRDPDTFVAVERRLARTNLAPVTPPGWIVAWFFTHPPVLERIGMAELWRNRNGRHDPRFHRPP
ncbi:MAG TPA: M48 family metalloprotease [Gemmatimonadota bacterium]|nr:M48 family metalloprotease [Gemmatimonadota bacterium]